MIKAPQLLADLTRLLKRLEEDLLRRIDEVTELKASLQSEWQAARDADRTAETFETWVDQVITQAGVHWLLSCVFLRFIEDNKLVDRPWLGGTPESGNLALARDRHEAYFRANPLHSDREYLLASFREAGALPGLHTFFDEGHNPVFRLGISGDAAMAVRQFWQLVDPNTGALAHDFTDPTWNTRFLGDLYQDLSEATRKRYALLQTPEFVEEFILDRTLDPAITEFGYKEVRLIDPTCGSGHFLLGGFKRLLDHWQRNEPARNVRDSVQQALNGIYGVDLNPFAVAISRFRLLVAALKASGETRLAEAPNFSFHLAAGDSLLHGPELGRHQDRSLFSQAETHRGTALEHAFAVEDLADLNRILGQTYHAVVGNPPYITVKDAALNAAYRTRYKTCHMKYSLGVPFTERFFELARRPASADFSHDAGYVGLITANSFMKRQFGVKLIEDFLPRLDLTHIIDTSGAHIPGHGTPTVILFGRERPPIASVVRTVMGIQAEPSPPANPAQGLVWRAIVDQVDIAGSESVFISVSDTPRESFSAHPWSIGGGGVADLKDLIEGASSSRLGSVVYEMGFGCVISEEEAFEDCNQIHLAGAADLVRPIVAGDEVRDWQIAQGSRILFPYDSTIELLPEQRVAKALWWARTMLGSRRDFGNRSYVEVGRPWWEYHQIPTERNRTPLTITLGEIATHNHFVLDRGGKVFKQTAPIIKLPAGTSEEEHLGLLGLLNSSVACFWLKRVCFPKDGQGLMWDERFAFNATNVGEFPVTESRPVAQTRAIVQLVDEFSASAPAIVIQGATPTRASFDAVREKNALLRRQLIAAQEELDWYCYGLYGLTQADLTYANPPDINFAERAFEIALARRMAAGQEESNWFDRHNATPISEIPAHWPEDYRHVVEARIALIESDKFIALIERPLYKRRWATTTWEEQEQAALKGWLLDRLEAALKVGAGETAALTTTNKLADRIRPDADFMQVAALYAGHADFDPAQLVAELVVSEAVPFLPVLRYTDTGLRKRAQWEDTWALQRREDAGEPVGNIPVPPKYQNKDFLKSDVWRLRGGLDVPKERWISYPGCERGADTSLPIAWAGWDHLQQATALAAYYLEMKESEGWEVARLQPLLAGLLELVPWLEQWHNEVDPVFGERMGAYYKGFVSEEARSHGVTLDDLRTWKPAASPVRRGRRKAT